MFPACVCLNEERAVRLCMACLLQGGLKWIIAERHRLMWLQPPTVLIRSQGGCNQVRCLQMASFPVAAMTVGIRAQYYYKL